MIYNRIPILRAEAGLTRHVLADKLGINYQTVGFIERSDYMPSLELAFKIAEVFDVELSVVFSDEPFEPIFVKKGKK